jgi:hypothetical protein
MVDARIAYVLVVFSNSLNFFEYNFIHENLKNNKKIGDFCTSVFWIFLIVPIFFCIFVESFDKFTTPCYASWTKIAFNHASAMGVQNLSKVFKKCSTKYILLLQWSLCLEQQGSKDKVVNKKKMWKNCIFNKLSL